MSQAKVDKYKKERKNRAKAIKKKRIRNFILLMLLLFCVSMAIGYPLGRFLYKKSYEKRMENSTISVQSYYYWSQQYMDSEYGYLFSTEDTSIPTEDTSDTEESEDTDDTTSVDAVTQ